MIKVILPASRIPLNETVTKVSGATEYTLKQSIVIYGGENKKQEIHAESGCLFLVGDRGNINVIPSHQELAWRVDEQVLSVFLQDKGDNQ